MDFFQNIDRPCPYNFNPADHYIHVLAVTPGYETQCKDEIKRICDEFTESDPGRQVMILIIISTHAYENEVILRGQNIC